MASTDSQLSDDGQVWPCERIEEHLQSAFFKTIKPEEKHWSGLTNELGKYISGPLATPSSKQRILLELVKNVLSKAPQSCDNGMQDGVLHYTKEYTDAVQLATEACCITSLCFFLPENAASGSGDEDLTAEIISIVLEIINKAESPIDSEALWRTIIFVETETLGSDGFQKGVDKSGFFSKSPTVDPYTVAKPFLVNFDDGANGALTYATFPKYGMSTESLTTALAAMHQINWIILTWVTFCPLHHAAAAPNSNHRETSAVELMRRIVAVQAAIIGQLKVWLGKKGTSHCEGKNTIRCVYPPEVPYQRTGSDLDTAHGISDARPKLAENTSFEPFFAHENDFHKLLCLAVKPLSRLASHPPYGIDAEDSNFMLSKAKWIEAFRACQRQAIENTLSLLDLLLGDSSSKEHADSFLNERQIGCFTSPFKVIRSVFGHDEAKEIVIGNEPGGSSSSSDSEALAFAKSFFNKPCDH